MNGVGAKKRARMQAEHSGEALEERVEQMSLVREDELPPSDDDEEVISD